MRLAAAAAFVLFASTTALAQPGAGPEGAYGPPPPPQQAPQPPTYAPQPPPPTYAPQPAPPAPQPYGQPQPAPQPYPYGQPAPQPYPQQPQPYGQPQPAPQPYPYGQPQPQPYGQGQYPRPYYAPQHSAPYAQPPVASLTQPAIREIKKPGTAQLLSVGATGLGLLGFFAAVDDNNEELALASAGLTLIGPSAGHIYAGENGHALKMTLLRTGGLLTFIWGAANQNSYDCIDYCYEEDDNDEADAAMVIGGAVFVVGTLYDLYDSGRAARRFNEKAARALTIGPTMMSSANGTRSPGVALSGSF